MITKEDFKSLFETWQSIIDVQTEGLTREDLLLQPKPGGNCMLWILGHMAESMKDLTVELGGSTPKGYDVYERFARTSEPLLGDEPGLPDLAKIRADYAALSNLACQALDEQSDDYFKEPGWSGTKGATILFLSFHMSYHSGHVETMTVLRRTQRVTS
ncbi:MAG: DinB family protein [Anaerolineaceae bacterium]